MKKLSLILVLVLLFSTVCGFAEGIDLSGMSDEEISETYSKILDEMRTRGIVRSDLLGEGIYEGGVDIAVGSYNISCGKDHNVVYALFDTRDLYEQYNTLKTLSPVTLKMEILTNDDTPVKIDLQEGNLLYVTNGTLKVEEARTKLMP